MLRHLARPYGHTKCFSPPRPFFSVLVLVSRFFSSSHLCIPFFPPTTTVASLEQVIKISPILYYQLQNVSGDVEEIVGKRDGRLRSYLNAMFGGVTPEGLPGFDPAKGIIEERLDAVQASPLVDPEIMNYYGEYSSALCNAGVFMTDHLAISSPRVLSTRTAGAHELVPSS